MALGDVVKAVCPRCGPATNAEIKAVYFRPPTGTQALRWDEILECRGCDTIYHRMTHAQPQGLFGIFAAGENAPPTQFIERYWPERVKRENPSWLWEVWLNDNLLGNLFYQTYQVLNGGLNVFAAIGMRTVFDRSAELLGIDENQPFAKKLDKLVEGGDIGISDREALHTLIDAGGAAVHRGWSPTDQDLDTMMHVIEGFLHRTFILKKKAASLRSAVPPRAQLAKPTSP